MKVTVRSTINPVKMTQGLRNNPKLWTFAASEWWRYISPYTPFATGQLMSKVRIEPKRIIYQSPYAKTVYNSVNRRFRKDKHPLATAKWDIVARPIQQRKLVMSLQQYLKRGNIDG